MADSGGGGGGGGSAGGKFSARFKQTAGQIRKEVEFKNALMRHLAEKCAKVENDSSNSDDEMTAKEDLQIEASRDELVAQLEADAETRKFRERQALSHAVHSQHMELLLRRGLEEVRQRRREAERQKGDASGDRATGDTSNETTNETSQSKEASQDAPRQPTNHEPPDKLTNKDDSSDPAIGKKTSDGDVTSASNQSQDSTPQAAPTLAESRRAFSIEDASTERLSRIKLAQTRNNSFGQMPSPPNSAPANKTNRFDYV